MYIITLTSAVHSNCTLNIHLPPCTTYNYIHQNHLPSVISICTLKVHSPLCTYFHQIYTHYLPSAVHSTFSMVYCSSLAAGMSFQVARNVFFSMAPSSVKKMCNGLEEKMGGQEGRNRLCRHFSLCNLMVIKFCWHFCAVFFLDQLKYKHYFLQHQFSLLILM